MRGLSETRTPPTPPHPPPAPGPRSCTWIGGARSDGACVWCVVRGGRGRQAGAPGTADGPYTALPKSGQPALPREPQPLEGSVGGDQGKAVRQRVYRDREVEVAHPLPRLFEPGLALSETPADLVAPGQADELRPDRGPLCLERPAALRRRAVAQPPQSRPRSPGRSQRPRAASPPPASAHPDRRASRRSLGVVGGLPEGDRNPASRAQGRGRDDGSTDPRLPASPLHLVRIGEGTEFLEARKPPSRPSPGGDQLLLRPSASGPEAPEVAPCDHACHGVGRAWARFVHSAQGRRRRA